VHTSTLLKDPRIGRALDTGWCCSARF